jgi:ubiquinone/menaquinone biosynthesis C-methylase UbiE
LQDEAASAITLCKEKHRMSETMVSLIDGWTTDASYKELYQADQEVTEVLELLRLEDATALLDNGCGNGEFSVQAGRAFPRLEIYGYDGLESAIAEARKRASCVEHENLNFDVAWADSLPLPNASIDRSLFRSVLHHVAEPRRVFSEFARCMKADGLLVLQTPFNSWEDSFSKFLSEFHFLMDDSHRRFYYTMKQICDDLESCDFSATKESVSAYPFPFVTQPMKDLILQNGFEDRLKLNQVSEDKWSVTLYWARITAIKKA